RFRRAAVAQEGPRRRGRAEQQGELTQAERTPQSRGRRRRRQTRSAQRGRVAELHRAAGTVPHTQGGRQCTSRSVQAGLRGSGSGPEPAARELLGPEPRRQARQPAARQRPPSDEHGAALSVSGGSNDSLRFARAAWRSSASATSFSTSADSGTPLASHRRGYWLARVKPGIVLISFTSNRPV